MRLMGIDGCRAGWVVAEADDDLASMRFSIVSNLSAVVDQATAARSVVVIDIPIGLPDSGPRSADIAARQAVKPRGSSVFPAPCRATLPAGTYQVACALNGQACGKRLSRQAFAILPKIPEVDQLVTPDIQGWVREGHPEVTFATLAGHAMRHSKKTVQGEQDRLAILAANGLQFGVQATRLALGRGRVATDDLIDAAACLMTAYRIFAARARILPAGVPCRDAKGLRTEIVA
jgi:predicted RNase H-like nuclease